MYIPLTFEGALSKCIFATAVSGAMEGYFISGSQQWKYHWFTGSGDLVVDKGTIDNVQIYVVGGGGGGGTGDVFNGGGGGGGGGVTYTMDARLFKGAYAVRVGAGGYPILEQDADATNGVNSSFIGSNITMIANGGGGGKGDGTGGTAGSVNSGAGGAGGNASGANGGYGTTIYFISQSAQGYGCGGGGASSVFNGNDGDGGCNDAGSGSPTGAAPGGGGPNRYGVGGGGGNGPGYQYGGEGGSGSVMIQYPIYDYCNNYFNETGSCGCREVTFDTTYPLNYYPNRTGSYLYMPCGEDNYVSGSLIAFAPLTVCAVSNSYFSYSKPAANELFTTVTAGLVNDTWLGNAPQCVSASITPTTCSVEWFPSTCTSSIVTIYTPSGSGGNPADFYYVAKNATSHSVYTSTSAKVNYVCISTGSLYGQNQIYPQLLAGDYVYLYNTASCNTIELQASWAGKGVGAGSTTYYYYACNGAKTSVTLSRPTTNFTGTISASFCRDMLTPTYFVRSGIAPTEYLYTGSVCLGENFDTGSCGCP